MNAIDGLPLRQAEGFLRSVLALMNVDLEAPDQHHALAAGSAPRSRTPSRPDAGALHLVVDSTGLSVVGEGEWAAAKHGNRGKRSWNTASRC